MGTSTVICGSGWIWGSGVSSGLGGGGSMIGGGGVAGGGLPVVIIKGRLFMQSPRLMRT